MLGTHRGEPRCCSAGGRCGARHRRRAAGAVRNDVASFVAQAKVAAGFGGAGDQLQRLGAYQYADWRTLRRWSRGW